MGAPVAQALVPAVSRLVSTLVAGVTRCRTKNVPTSGDAAGRSACATSYSSQHLLMQYDVGPPAHVAQPDIHLLVGALAGELALDLVAIIFQRHRLSRMSGLRRGFHRLGEILVHVRVGEL